MTCSDEQLRKILMIAYHFPPATSSAVQRSGKFAKYLPRFGYQPVVLAGGTDAWAFANDPAMVAELGATPIVRCPARPSRWMRAIRRIGMPQINPGLFLGDPLSRTWLPDALRAGMQLASQHRLQAIYASFSPSAAILLGCQLKKTLGIPLILDFRDPWTTAYRLWLTPLHYVYEARQERAALAIADRIVVVTPTMREILVEQFPQHASKIHVIPNGYDEDDIQPLADPPPPSQTLRIGFTGMLVDYQHDRFLSKLTGLAKRVVCGSPPNDKTTHTPYYLFRAIRALLDEHPGWKSRLSLRFAGGFGAGNERLVAAFGLQSIVTLKGYLTHGESVKTLMESDVLFLPIVSPTNGRRSYIHCGKLFEYLASGKPILAAVPEGDAKTLIQEAGAGWCVDPYDIQGVKRLLEELIVRKEAGTLGIRRDEECVRRFERKVLTGQLASLFDSVVGESSARFGVNKSSGKQGDGIST